MKKIVASLLLGISIIFLFKGFNDLKYRISNKVNVNIDELIDNMKGQSKRIIFIKKI